jgi:deoxycytidylate deaminase
LVSGGHVIAVGYNQQKASPFFHELCSRASERDSRRTGIHAELDALGQSNGNAKGAVMYVARVRADDSVANATPCSICQTELERRGVRRVHYTVGEVAGRMEF